MITKGIVSISKNYRVVDIRSFRRSSSSIDNSGARNKYVLTCRRVKIDWFIVLLQFRCSNECGCFEICNYWVGN